MTMFLSPIRNRRSLFSFSVPSRDPSEAIRLAIRLIPSFGARPRFPIGSRKIEPVRAAARRTETEKSRSDPLGADDAMYRAQRKATSPAASHSRRRRTRQSRHCFPCSLSYVRERSVFLVRSPLARCRLLARSPALLVSCARSADRSTRPRVPLGASSFPISQKEE